MYLLRNALLYNSVHTSQRSIFKNGIDYKNGSRLLKNKWIFKFEVILESLGKILSNTSSFKNILASLQTNMAKSQISRVDIRIGKGGLDQSQTKNKLGKHFFIINYHKLFKKHENLCLKDTFGKNLQKKGTV